jgi:hypothetical protein
MKNSKYNIWFALLYEIINALGQHYENLKKNKIIAAILRYCKHDWILWKIESTLLSVDKQIDQIQKEWDKREPSKTIYTELPPDGSEAQRLLGGEMRITENYKKD